MDEMEKALDSAVCAVTAITLNAKGSIVESVSVTFCPSYVATVGTVALKFSLDSS